GVIGLEVAVRLAVEQHVARGRKRTAALPDRVGELLLPRDLVGAGIDRGERTAVFRADRGPHGLAEPTQDAALRTVGGSRVEVAGARRIRHRGPVPPAVAAG